jgi:hypothetical protein
MTTKPHYRRADLAARYQVDLRTVANMVADGRLPPPDFYLGRFPIWHFESIENNERAAAARRPAEQAKRSAAAPRAPHPKTANAETV